VAVEEESTAKREGVVTGGVVGFSGAEEKAGGMIRRGEPLDGICGVMDDLGFFVTRCFLSFSSRRKNQWACRVHAVCFLGGRVGEAGGIFLVRAVRLG
jgi:hypothetical protein